jgi:iron complex outermembrane receptor protein
MYRRLVQGLSCAFIAMIATPARTEVYAFPIDIKDGLLAVALQDLARQTGAELLFDRNVLGDRHAAIVRGRLSTEAALQRLVAGSGLTVRRAASGAWLVERAAVADRAAPQDLAIPEILVVGRRTHNVDIRRRGNDIQPYQIVTGEAIAGAHRDDIDQFFRSRITANTDPTPTRAIRGAGQTNSQIDLRGFGSDQTLILIDGRRMPAIPTQDLALQQPDLNAIPLHAIDRVETLMGTAGGIYGIGALGGMVNVILRRDLRGLEVHGTSGITARGDASRLTLEGGIGFSPDHGATEVMLYLSGTWEQPLLMGQRDYGARGRAIISRVAPRLATPATFTANAIQVRDSFGDPLIFKPEYGGASLGSEKTYMVSGFSGTPADMVAMLTQHAGMLATDLSDGDRATYVGSVARTASAMLNMHHDFGAGIEAYADALILRNRGRYRDRANTDRTYLQPESPFNPFESQILVTFPAPWTTAIYTSRYESERYTAGLVVPLPRGWKGTAEASLGTARYSRISDNPDVRDFASDPNPFGDLQALQQALNGESLANSDVLRERNRYRNASIRLAGPAFRTAAGLATLTLLAETRREKVPRFDYVNNAVYYDAPSVLPYASRSNVTHSVYAELAAPLIGEDASIPIVRGLQLQLAVRRDVQKSRFLQDVTLSDDPTALQSRDTARFAEATYTVGAKFFPIRWMMLRGSYATGRQAPPLQYIGGDYWYAFSTVLTDARRGNQLLGDGQQVTFRLAPSLDLKMVRASTLALGVVFNPRGDGGPRVSLDYSRILRTNDPYQAAPATFVLQYEDAWPYRVVREPLTDADRSRGYTGGRVTTIYETVESEGRRDVRSIDGRLDWAMPLAGGTLKTYGSATLQLRNENLAPFGAADKRIAYLGGPLRWRANGGMDWTYKRTTFGANAQYFSHYRIYAFNGGDPNDALGFDPIGGQGSRFVKAQAYLDLAVRHRLQVQWAGKRRDLGIDFGIVNVLDRAPPYEYSDGGLGPMISWYGDPRGRRFELSFNASF